MGTFPPTRCAFSGARGDSGCSVVILGVIVDGITRLGSFKLWVLLDVGRGILAAIIRLWSLQFICLNACHPMKTVGQKQLLGTRDGWEILLEPR